MGAVQLETMLLVHGDVRVSLMNNRCYGLKMTVASKVGMRSLSEMTDGRQDTPS